MDALVSCGPYYLAEYVPNQYSVYKKNENYVQADRIKTDTIKKWLWTIHSPSSMRINPVS